MKVLLYLPSRMGICDIIKIVPDVPNDASDKYIQSLFKTEMGIKYDNRNYAYVILPKSTMLMIEELGFILKRLSLDGRRILLTSKLSEKLLQERTWILTT